MCRVGQIQRAVAHPHPPLISHPLQRKSLQFLCQECHVPCKQKLGPNLSDLHRLQRNDWYMIRWMCVVTTKDLASSQDVLERMQLDELAKVIRTRQHRWHGHVERSDGWLKKVQTLNTTGVRGCGRLMETWTQMIDMDHLALSLTETHPSDRKVWSARLRHALRLDPALYKG